MLTQRKILFSLTNYGLADLARKLGRSDLIAKSRRKLIEALLVLKVDTAFILSLLQRTELQGICDSAGLGEGARDKNSLVLFLLQRTELQGKCDSAGLGEGARDKISLVSRILTEAHEVDKAVSEPREHNIDPNMTIDLIALGSRERRALLTLGIETIRDFLRQDLDAVFRLRGVGNLTFRRLVEAKGWITNQLSGDPTPINFEEVRLRLGGRARRVLDTLGVNNIGTFTMLSREDLQRVHSVGVRTWKEIERQQKLVRISNRNGPSGDENGPLLAKVILNCFQNPASIEGLAYLPLFSDITVRGLHSSDLHPTYLAKTSISSLKLPHRAQVVLSGKRIGTLGELLLIPGRALMGNNFGEITLGEVRATVKDFFLSHQNRDPDEIVLPWTKPVSVERLASLPLFTGMPIHVLLLPSDFHPTYSAQTLISNLRLPHRAQVALSRKRIETLGELLLVPGKALRRKNFGEITLERVRAAVKDFFLLQDKYGAEQTNVSDFGRMATTYTELVLEKGRNTDIVCAHFGMSGKEPKTLRQVAAEYGVSTQRASQICVNGLRQLSVSPHRALLKHFWEVVAETVRDVGGIIDLHDLGRRLATILAWSNMPPSPALRVILMLDPRFTFASGDIVIFSGGTCEKCPIAIRVLRESLSEAKMMQVSEASNLLRERCHKLCDKHQTIPQEFSAAFVESLVRTHLTDKCRVYNGRLLSRALWGLRYGSLPSVTEHILRQSKRAMHFTEVHDEILKRGGYDNLSAKRVYTALKHTRQVLRWGRATYIHRDCVKVPKSLITNILAWHLSKFDDDIPYLSIYGAFRHFRNRLRKWGIDTESALYTCLKEASNKKLFFPRIPYVCREKIGEKDRIPLTEILEELVLDAGGSLPYAEMKRIVCGQMLLSKTHLRNALCQTPNVSRAENGIIMHRKNL